MKITPQYLKGLITQAMESGASSDDIGELKDYLEQVESGKLNHRVGRVLTHGSIDSHGRTVVHISTAPITPDRDDDFAGLTPKSIKQKR